MILDMTFTIEAAAWIRFRAGKQCLDPRLTLVLAADHTEPKLRYIVQEYPRRDRTGIEQLKQDKNIEILEMVDGR